ncbi:PilZ domain-containing protein [Psychrosphaera sp. F3M07]|uniref:PilZ domain-containing protein n=1 Tax=Psychrosphaera sp. F3M07 TaxID=2841560 RepID=UPI001C07F705|nr:PilZ domain-containing protein [Psychrosphaera sp. F3M07]MBU2916506.1 PilZ domain-containing protein [Psychrosphaera sp. F3M07]
MTEQDLELFSEYFQLEHQIPVNIKDGGDWDSIPTMDQFEAMIPTPYKIASEMKGLEQTMLRPLRQLGDVIEPLAEYLKAQSRKIDLMMSYILQGQDDDDLKFQASSYGGGGFVFQSEQVFTLNNWIQCKLFFNEEAAAVFCLGKIVEVETISPDEDIVNNEPPATSYTYKVVFHRIRDEDREVVVRASLHQQSKLLLNKTKQRSNK